MDNLKGLYIYEIPQIEHKRIQNTQLTFPQYMPSFLNLAGVNISLALVQTTSTYTQADSSPKTLRLNRTRSKDACG